MIAVTYFNKRKALTDELALARKKLDEDNIINVVLDGLDSDYNALVVAVSGRIDQGITLSKVYSMLLIAEARLVAQNAERGSSGGGDFFVNLASRNGYNGGGRYNGGNRGGSSCGNDGRGYDQGRYDGCHDGCTNQGAVAIKAALRVDMAMVVEVTMEVVAVTPSKEAIVLATMVHHARFVLSQVIQLISALKVQS
jgi:hypothetical protein